MSDDIVTRLRGSWDCSCLYIKEHGLDRKCLHCEAADEIERLRAYGKRWRKIADYWYKASCSHNWRQDQAARRRYEEALNNE